jgi:hypothetical protein
MSVTRREYKCPQCERITEVSVPLSQNTPTVYCPVDGSSTHRYFGGITDIPINYGFRPERYLKKEDERIAQYQFENL